MHKVKLNTTVYVMSGQGDIVGATPPLNPRHLALWSHKHCPLHTSL